jgi:hypothetical protein
MKYLALGLLVSLSTLSAYASEEMTTDMRYYQVDKMTVSLVEKDVLGVELREKIYQRSYSELPQMPYEDGKPSVADEAGKIIGVARDLVALGEDVYNLVIKGKPNISTDYSPISVVPKINGQPADILETENWQMPKSVTYEIAYENAWPFNMEVVKFRYTVIYSYGGSYNGKGKYLTAVQIIPEQTSVLFGYDFRATMKLGGIANHGTRDNPIAGATLLLEHEVKTVVKANLETYAFQVLGSGGFKRIR